MTSANHKVTILFPKKSTLEIEYTFPDENKCACGGEYKDTLEKAPVLGSYNKTPEDVFHVGYDITQRCSKCYKIRETMGV